jgi:long-chain acyl-CoA synthetase
MPGLWLIDRLRTCANSPAILRGDQTLTYSHLSERIAAWRHRLRDDCVTPGHAVVFDADYDADALGLFLALLDQGNIAVPLSTGAVSSIATVLDITKPSHRYIRNGDGFAVEQRPGAAVLPLYAQCQRHHQGGIVILTSGSTGMPKASLHRADRFLAKFEQPHPALRTLLVLPIDHMAGLDSLFYALSSGGTLIIPEKNNPEGICSAIARHRAELLPATPSLLNLIWLSGALTYHDLTSLKIITYGAEVMPEVTLERLRASLPGCRFIQKYGATEFGSPRTRSRKDGSLWFKITGGEFETRIMDQTLWVRSPFSMLGYLNAPSPIDADGWMNTGDRVEVDGDYFRILGRQSEMINVGGHKVNPADVENVLLTADNISDALVYGERNQILGHTVTAVVRVVQPEETARLIPRIRTWCQERLPKESIPVKIHIADDQTWNSRYKKMRRTI